MSSYSKRRETAARTRAGMIRSMPALILSAARTIVRDMTDEPYCSGPSSSCAAESDNSVSETCMAFFEVQSVRIIIAPAASRIRKLAGTFSESAPIIICGSPECLALEKASNPATGTPMKFTRSLPAKASARANVPDRIVMRRMLILNRWMKNSSTEHATQQMKSDSSRCRSTIPTKALSASSDLSPLKTAK